MDEPFVFKSDPDDKGNVKWYGFSIDLLEKMATQIGFRYELVEYDQYGSLEIGKNGTKKWTGLVGAVERGDCDFAVSVKGYWDFYPYEWQSPDIRLHYL